MDDHTDERDAEAAGGHALSREARLVEVARNALGSIRLGVANLYLSGEFGKPDLKSAYAWVLAAWNRWDGDFAERVALAQYQQFLEFVLCEEDKRQAVLLIEGLLLDEKQEYVCGQPFNAGWWGWCDDDPCPPRPPETYFKEELVLWLRKAGWQSDEIGLLLEKCRPCNVPSGSSRKQWDLFCAFESRGEIPWEEETRLEYQSWLATRRARRSRQSR